ncbi:hypothetical protein JXQ31_03230 [candidate division KSB1 bacterium]|nr:hypothetical protein [candidate division KSB1 bacterium]
MDKRNIIIKRCFIWTISIISLFLYQSPVLSSTPKSLPYKWKNVAIGGGGSVPGLIIHPLVKDLVYIRTDMGSIYKWETEAKKWTPLWLWPSYENWNLTAVASIAVDPSDESGLVLYAAAGKYAADWAVPEKGEIFKSTDGGNTWKSTGLRVSVASNWDQRFGERLGVDPHNSDIVYYASRMDGLWRSKDGAKTWSKVITAPTGNKVGTSVQDKRGLTFIVFDKNTGENKVGCNTIYLGSWVEGVYRSIDGGETWDKLPACPPNTYRATIGPQGQLYVTHEKGLAKFNGDKWCDITPQGHKGKRFVAVTVDPSNLNHIITSPQEWAYNMPIFRSTDGGQTWNDIKYHRHCNVPWSPDSYWSAATFTLTIDPHDNKRVWYTDWYHTWVTPDITQDVTDWYTFEYGHEQMAPIALASPPAGEVRLYSGIADIGGFSHIEIDVFPEKMTCDMGLPATSTTGIDYAEEDPYFVVRANAFNCGQVGEIGCGYTMDGGETWTPMETKPFEEATGGRVAVSASGDRVVWLPQESCLFYTKNYGKSWLESYGAPENLITQFFNTDIPLASDRVLNNVFYIYADGEFFRSETGAEIWEHVGDLVKGENQRPIVKAAPGLPKEVWVSLNDDGLWQSNDGGNNFVKLPSVQQARLFDFGKNPSDKHIPAIYVYGKINKKAGIFRSDDMGKSWNSIDTFPNPSIGAEPGTMTGDRQVFGRVYIGTNGTGIFYGQPVDN